MLKNNTQRNQAVSISKSVKQLSRNLDQHGSLSARPRFADNLNKRMVNGDVISDGNAKTIMVYHVVNFEVDNPSCLRDDNKKPTTDREQRWRQTAQNSSNDAKHL